MAVLTPWTKCATGRSRKQKRGNLTSCRGPRRRWAAPPLPCRSAPLPPTPPNPPNPPPRNAPPRPSRRQYLFWGGQGGGGLRGIGGGRPTSSVRPVSASGVGVRGLINFSHQKLRKIREVSDPASVGRGASCVAAATPIAKPSAASMPPKGVCERSKIRRVKYQKGKKNRRKRLLRHRQKGG